MVSIQIIQVLVWGVLCLPITAIAMMSASKIFAISNNCSSESQPCGPVPSCCAPGLQCNFRRGIPICQDPTEQFTSGFDQDPCADPYLFRCDEIVQIPGFCCPIGTSCFTEGGDKLVQCINALGATQSSFPTATTGFIPLATLIPDSSPSIVFSPPTAWNISAADYDCTTSKSFHVTDVINASLSFPFTGPSIMVHMISSLNGGVFSVFVDGFNTTSEIDTFSGPGDLSLPLCYPLQFPPFLVTPTGYANRTNHTLTLVYIGPSQLSPRGTTSSVVQFDSFAIPVLESIATASHSDATSGLEKLNVHISSIFVLLSLFILL